jgi:hypothetical protein
MRIIIFTFILLTVNSNFSQLQIQEINDRRELEIDWNSQFGELEKYDNSFTKILVVDINQSRNNDAHVEVYKWLPNYDVTKFKILAYVIGDSVSKKFDVVWNNKKERKPCRQSTLFLITKNSIQKNYLAQNIFKLSLEKLNFQNDFGFEIYCLQSIKDPTDFKWKVNQLLFNLSNLTLEEPEKKKDELKNSFQINFNQSLFSSQNWKSDLSDLIYSKANINSLDFNFITRINNKIKVLCGASVFNLTGGVNADKISYSFLDYTSQGLSINRINTINNFSEIWKADNCLALNTGFEFSLFKSKNQKFDLLSSIIVGKFLPIVARTALESGIFNYEAKLDGIIDTLKNIQSLGLLNNVQYENGLYETVHLTGSKFQAQLNASYNLNSIFYVHGLLSFSIIHLRNVNYKANLPISKSYGDFSSSYNNVKSMTLLPFSIGLGVGIKF